MWEGGGEGRCVGRGSGGRFVVDVCAYGIVGGGGGEYDAAVISGTVMDGGEGVTQTQAEGGGGGTRYQSHTKIEQQRRHLRC